MIQISALLVLHLAACGDTVEDCRSQCGCWNAATLLCSTVITDATGKPLAGIQVTCKGEATPIAVSGQDGKAAFTIETRHSPGCNYERCTNLVFSDPLGVHATREATVFEANNQTLALTTR